jgi:hypothetical protein
VDTQTRVLGSGRTRCRRTIDPDQLTSPWTAPPRTPTRSPSSSSFIPANDRPADDTGPGFDSIVAVEAWFRRRTDIEDRICEAGHGAALRRLPLRQDHQHRMDVGRAARREPLGAAAALAGLDEGGRAHAARLRHELLCVPARLVRHGRTLTLRLPPGQHLLPSVLSRI